MQNSLKARRQTGCPLVWTDDKIRLLLTRDSQPKVFNLIATCNSLLSDNATLNCCNSLIICPGYSTSYATSVWQTWYPPPATLYWISIQNNSMDRLLAVRDEWSLMLFHLHLLNKYTISHFANLITLFSLHGVVFFSFLEDTCFSFELFFRLTVEKKLFWNWN